MAKELDAKAIRREGFLQQCLKDSIIARQAVEDTIIKALHDYGIQDEVIADILELIYQHDVEYEADKYSPQPSGSHVIDLTRY